MLSEVAVDAWWMETALRASRDGTVQEVLVHAGSPIDAKDLLVVQCATMQSDADGRHSIFIRREP